MYKMACNLFTHASIEHSHPFESVIREHCVKEMRKGSRRDSKADEPGKGSTEGRCCPVPGSAHVKRGVT